MSSVVSGSSVLSMRVRSIQQFAEELLEDRRGFEACTRRIRQLCLAVADRDARGQPAERRGRIHCGFGEAETKSGDGMHREEMTSVGRAALPAPAVLGEEIDDPEIFDQPI